MIMSFSSLRMSYSSTIMSSNHKYSRRRLVYITWVHEPAAHHTPSARGERTQQPYTLIHAQHSWQYGSIAQLTAQPMQYRTCTAYMHNAVSTVQGSTISLTLTTTEQAIDTAQYTRPTRAAIHSTPARTTHNIHSTQQHAH